MPMFVGYRFGKCEREEKRPSHLSQPCQVRNEKKQDEDEIVAPPDYDGTTVSGLEELLTPDDTDMISSEKYEEELRAAMELEEIIDLANYLDRSLVS